MTPLSVDAAVVVTDKSKSTLWRLAADGKVTKLAPEGKRAMLCLEDLAPFISIPLSSDDLRVLALADQGDPESQADIGQLFALAGRHSAALYWLMEGAERGSADAMQCLATAYASGTGVERDENISIMWLAKAAAGGHAIAREQMRGLRSSAKA